MDILIKNVPKNFFIKNKEIDFLSINDLFDAYRKFIDFREVEDKDVSQKLINSLKEMEEEIEKNGYKNFTSISS